jgi:hypothetical protein
MAAIVPGIPYMAMTIPRLVSVEMVEPLSSAFRQGSTISVVRIKAVVDVAVEAAPPVKPRTGPDKYAAIKPVGPVVAVGSAIVRWVIEVPIGAYRRRANVDTDRDLG